MTDLNPLEFLKTVSDVELVRLIVDGVGARDARNGEVPVKVKRQLAYQRLARWRRKVRNEERRVRRAQKRRHRRMVRGMKKLLALLRKTENARD